MLVALNARLQRAHRVQLIAGCGLLVPIVGALDHLTGYEISFSIFYLVPIVIAAWYLGHREGTGFAILAAAAWLAIDLAGAAQW